MRISSKVSLSFAALGLVVFGSAGALQVALERRDLEQDLIRDVSTLCRTAAESIRHDLGDRGSDDIDALLRGLVRFDPSLEVVLWREGRLHPERRETAEARRRLLDEVGRDAVSTGGIVVHMEALGTGPRHVAVAVPITGLATKVAVALVRPLDELDADLRREGAIMALAVLAFSVLAGVLGFGLGEVYIRRPLERLDEAMAALAAGDTTAAPLVQRRDEVGRVSTRFLAMRTELVRAQAQLQAEQDAHRSTLEHLTAADRLVTIGQLAAGLAHEIGSPLQILHGRAQKLLEGAEPGGEIARIAQILVSQTDRITRIVRQLLTFARPREPSQEQVDPASCVAPVLDLLRLEAKRKHITVELEAPPSEPVTLDPDALQQIVFNLARNAIAALHEGGTVHVRLRVVAAAPRHLLLEVADDGPGIPEAIRARVFEPFFTTSAGGGGIGLGLTVVRSLVEGTGGSIGVRPRDGGGTEFTVTLPC